MKTALLPNKDGHIVETEIPKYIDEILKRVYNLYDYTFKLNGKYLFGHNRTLESDMEKLEKWAKRYNADCKVITVNNNRSRTERMSGKHIDHILFELTDPVCQALEKAGYLLKKASA
jgi:hypothetical protein